MHIAPDPLRYPIGRFEKPYNGEYPSKLLKAWIEDIAAFPALLRQEVESLSDVTLELTYRPGGWTIRQVVHHCADSHMNALVRFKLALTQDSPRINPYQEAVWAELPDTLNLPIEPSLQILEGLHLRWVTLLRTFGPQDWQSGYFHPEYDKHVNLTEATGQYAWHCRHHLAHVRVAKGLEVS